MPDIRVGDTVSWNTPQGRTRGRVVKRLTSATTVGGTEIHATKDDPGFLVESDTTGARAAHTADALRRAERWPAIPTSSAATSATPST